MNTAITKELLQKCGKTQKEVAKDLGFSQQRFNYYVNGSREPDASTLVRIADYFNVTTDYLLGRKGSMENQKDPPPEEGGLTDEQKEIIRLFEAASPEAQAAALSVLRLQEAQDRQKDTS